MKEDTLYNILIGISLVAIIAILILIFTTKTEESFTELYFEDHTTLPGNVSLGESYDFSFSIHNLEQESISYDYSVYIVEEDGTTTPLDSSSLTLNNEETATISESFTLEESFSTAKVIVELNTGEEIHFWITEQ